MSVFIYFPGLIGAFVLGYIACLWNMRNPIEYMRWRRLMSLERKEIRQLPEIRPTRR